nr:mitochondrial basic amino acids transporter-like [Leptinotarsa decemlineata]
MSLDFFAGCVGGMAGVTVGHPLDTAKVLLQTQDTKNPRYSGTIDCLRSLLAKEGIKGIYRGVTSPLLGVAGINAIVFGVYGNTQRILSNPDSLKSHAIAGGAAGLFQSFICSPIELAKSRLQVSNNVGKGPIECLCKIFATEGLKGVFKGLGLTIGREVPSYSAYFFTYELLTRSDNDEPVSTGRMLMAGGFAGVASWLITYPVDLIKSRMQVDGITSKQYTSSYDCFRKTVQSGGISCLFKGLAPTLIRAFPVNAVTFTVVTWTMRIFNGESLVETVEKTESMLKECADVFGELAVS